MGIPNRFVFMFGGVFVQKMDAICQEISPNFHLDSVWLRKWTHQLTLGQITLDEFREKLMKESSESGESWEADFASSVLSNQPMQPVIEALAGNFELFLLSDYPEDLYENVFPQIPFSRHFDQVIFMRDAGPHESFQSLFEHLTETGILRPGNTLYVDWHSLRTKTAINLGLCAAIFVDAPRFYRDLGIWGYVPMQDIQTIKTKLNPHP